MKRIVLFLMTLGICCWAGAQEHLKFKNIPIDGPEKAFVEALCQNEFHLVNDGQFGAALRGRFTGKTVDVFVIPTSEGTTSRVAVNYPSPDNWGSLRLDFYTLLRSLSFKYGEPVEMSQEFQLPFSRRNSSSPSPTGTDANWKRSAGAGPAGTPASYLRKARSTS